MNPRAGFTGNSFVFVFRHGVVTVQPMLDPHLGYGAGKECCGHRRKSVLIAESALIFVPRQQFPLI
jgi:hypothetical protein